MDYQAIVDGFEELARAYCAWLEAEPLPQSEEHMTALSFVAQLYAQAVRLPDVDPSHLPENLSAPVPDPSAIAAVRERLGTFPFQYYWEVFNTLTEAPEEPCCGDITDDLADIYGDLKTGLLALDASGQPLAVWHWSFSFGVHWGRHATSAMRALHEFDSDASVT